MRRAGAARFNLRGRHIVERRDELFGEVQRVSGSRVGASRLLIVHLSVGMPSAGHGLLEPPARRDRWDCQPQAGVNGRCRCEP